MMTLDEFKAYVKRDFKRQDKDTEIVQAYNDMVIWVSVMMPHGNYKYQSYVATTVGVEDYQLPTNLIHLMHPIRLLLGSGASDSGFPLEKLTKEEYDIREPNPNRTNPPVGMPSAYTVFSRSVLVTPVCDKATYILEINWTKLPVDLVDGTDYPTLGSEWREVLKQGTLERLYAALGQFDEAKWWGNQYHGIGPGYDLPVGLCAKLFDIEKAMEGKSVGSIAVNSL